MTISLLQEDTTSNCTTPEDLDGGSHVSLESKINNKKLYGLASSKKSKTVQDQVTFPLPLKTKKPTETLECDKNTPDAHVFRDSRLIRLTGVHPLNCEPPLSLLYDSGFLTPIELWVVRNHGPVPEVKNSEVLNWTITVEGMVETTLKMTLLELLSYSQTTLPITLVCAGNRRKEQNVLRKSNGFNYGSAGHSTALFTGVLMSEILKVAKPKQGARYMCMEGGDNLPNGHYGTSIRLSTAMNPAMGVMLAHKMNGEPLTPDHGRPLRAVIPGQVAGRSVKWLKRIIITEKPSDNWYHLFDNRVLPTIITPEIAAENKQWFYDERYAIYNINVQSAICYPAHEEIVEVKENKSYAVRGYALNGGGIRVGRVEVSLDQGQTWRLADIDYPEDQYRSATNLPNLYGGKLDMANREPCFSWCFWKIEIPIMELFSAKDIVVRAMDEHMNIQPRDIYWNVLGMLHNCWHRLTITQISGGRYLKFDHPTVPGPAKGGWMEQVKEQGGQLTDGFWGSRSLPSGASSSTALSLTTTVKMTNDTVTRTITEEELAKHDKDDDAWFAVDGNVYDATRYLNEHPGGAQAIITASGKDASEDFMAIHSDVAKAMLAQYHIGVLKSKSVKQLTIDQPQIDNSNGEIFLARDRWKKSVLKTKIVLSHDSVRLTFVLDHPRQKLGVPIGQYLYIRCVSSSGEKVVRAYTPVSETDQLGQFDLVIKIYRSHGEQPAGKMSACIDVLKPGDTIECKGPFGDHEFQHGGLIKMKHTTERIRQLTMIAGGTGITAVYPILRFAQRQRIKCRVIDCNRTEEDILLREELNNFDELYHCLQHPSAKWKGYTGYVTKEMMGPVHDGYLICCGPPRMLDSIRQIAAEGGWDIHKRAIFL